MAFSGPSKKFDPSSTGYFQINHCKFKEEPSINAWFHMLLTFPLHVLGDYILLNQQADGFDSFPTEGKHLRRALRERRRKQEPQPDIEEMEENCDIAKKDAERMAARVQASQISSLPIFQPHKHSCNGKCGACRSRKKDKALTQGDVWRARTPPVIDSRHQQEAKMKRTTEQKASRRESLRGISLLTRGVGERGRRPQNFTSQEILDELAKRQLPPVQRAAEMPREDGDTLVDEEGECDDAGDDEGSQMYAYFGRDEELDKEEEIVESLQKGRKWLVTKEQRLADAVTVAFSAHKRREKARWEIQKAQGLIQDIDPLSLAERTMHMQGNITADTTHFSDGRDARSGPPANDARETRAVDQQYLGLTMEQHKAHQRPSSRARQRRLNQVGGPGTDPFKRHVPPPLVETTDRKQATYVAKCEAAIIEKSQNIQRNSCWKKTAIY